MSEISIRAQKILTWIQGNPHPSPLPEGGFWIRQQTLAELFGCSRRSIGRALKELKEAGLLVDLNRRAENRCKMYRHCEEPQATGLLPASQACSRNDELTPEAQQQWDFYERTFALVFRTPHLKKYYAQVTWSLSGIKDENELYSKTFSGLFAIAE